MKRRKMAQEENDKLLKLNQELQDKVPAIEEELTRLQRRYQVLYGLPILLEDAHKI